MDSAKQQLIDKLKSSSNVLVTVSRNPSVDQLSALLGLSLIVNKIGKHCAAVFSGEIPSTIEFLKPEETIEKTTDSLRDFIIALDKNKADKLRYKVEDNIVRIFITPYKTSITQDDLEFSQGDFNVDLLIGLGVKEQADLDDAITSHGRILHDATVASINIEGRSDLGSINWVKDGASSLSELVTDLARSVGDKVVDNQIATALLTGIVAETDRFRNEKTSSETMSASAELMAAGANQQLVASQLEQAGTATTGNSADAVNDQDDDGTLEISHDNSQPTTDDSNKPADVNAADFKEIEPVDTDKPSEESPEPVTGLSNGPKLVTEPPALGGQLTANSQQNVLEPSTDPLSMPDTEEPQILERKPNNIEPLSSTPVDTTPPVPPTLPSMPADEKPENLLDSYTPPPSGWTPPEAAQPEPTQEAQPTQPEVAPPPEEPKSDVPQLHIDDEGTLKQIEESVHSPHIYEEDSTSETDVAREAVNEALGTKSEPDNNNSEEASSSTAPPVPPPIYPQATS